MTYIDKLLEIQFKKLDTRSWFRTIMYWIIDARYGKAKRLDHFLKDQLRDPAAPLIELAHRLRGRNPYDTVHRIERWVDINLKYETDKKNWKVTEYWATALETLNRGVDDCEGQNSLIYILCRLAGIPASNLYCCLGEIQKNLHQTSIHYWLLFFDSRRSRFVKLDTTVYPEIKSIKRKKQFKLGKTYKTIDYLFNETGIWRFKQ